MTVEFALVESHNTVGKREQGVVLAHADIGTRIELGAALAHDDVAGDDVLAAELLHAKATTGRITTVTRRTACFFMCHRPRSLLLGFSRLGSGLFRRSLPC